ncbi:sensory neuron membrane protein 2-like [Teleopsis dalmanni]|uniref:sensory neuron membrane protein 2-like n=1 Tax=Teleopsis dalmanni TaxID=139649 RepID=UPI0018CFA261|nr:sensory neuron membrane protein 2-like [Teleopsis dalmanni]
MEEYEYDVNSWSRCATDAPVILTLPHMLGASNEYRKMIRGLKPDAKKHQTFVDVQMLTGTPLQGGKRVQFNMFLKSINRITITENLTTVLMPAIWVEEGIQLNNEMVAFFKKKLINSLKTLNIVHWASLCGGIGVALICLMYYVVYRRKPIEEAPLK